MCLCVCERREGGYAGGKRGGHWADSGDKISRRSLGVGLRSEETDTTLRCRPGRVGESAEREAGVGSTGREAGVESAGREAGVEALLHLKRPRNILAEALH